MFSNVKSFVITPYQVVTATRSIADAPPGRVYPCGMVPFVSIINAGATASIYGESELLALREAIDFALGKADKA